MSFLGVGDIQLLAWHKDLERHYNDVYDNVVSDEDKRRMKSSKQQIETTKDQFRRNELDIQSFFWTEKGDFCKDSAANFLT